VTLRLIDWIWHVRGSLALAPGQSSESAFDSLAPLFGQTGTSYERTNDTLTFSKKDPAAQDKMSVFDGGTLRIDSRVAGPVLHYHLTSRTLLFCLLASFLFLGIAQFTAAINKFDKPPPHEEKKHEDIVLNPIDKALGSPEPDNSKKEDDKEDEDEKLSPKAAYVFSGLFAVLYAVGRILESKLVKALFEKNLLKPQ
jgi:hypothetical protein